MSADRAREVALSYKGRGVVQRPMRGADDAARELRRIIPKGATREHFVALHLDGRHCLVSWEVVSVGTATASLVHPREVFQSALIQGACALIVGHNHTSGDPSPSVEDRRVTERLAQAGELLGVRVLDHVVVGGSRHVSLKTDQPQLFR